MGEQQIGNPAGAYGATPTLANSSVISARNTNAAALPQGTVVVLAYSTTTGEVSCDKAATTTDLDFVFGVTKESIGIGKQGQVVVRGLAYVKVGSGTVANGDGAIRSGTVAGEAAPVTPDATTIAGQTMGTFIGAKGSASPYPGTTQAPLYVGKY